MQPRQDHRGGRITSARCPGMGCVCKRQLGRGNSASVRSCWTGAALNAMTESLYEEGKHRGPHREEGGMKTGRDWSDAPTSPGTPWGHPKTGVRRGRLPAQCPQEEPDTPMSYFRLPNCKRISGLF